MLNSLIQKNKEAILNKNPWESFKDIDSALDDHPNPDQTGQKQQEKILVPNISVQPNKELSFVNSRSNTPFQYSMGVDSVPASNSPLKNEDLNKTTVAESNS